MNFGEPAGSQAPVARSGQTLRVVKKLSPHQAGAVKLGQKYGSSLICVRHRVDPKGQFRYTTVELLIERTPIRPRKDRVVGVRIHYAERSLQSAAKASGAVWDAKAKLWRMPSRVAATLGLRERIVET